MSPRGQDVHELYKVSLRKSAKLIPSYCQEFVVRWTEFIHAYCMSSVRVLDIKKFLIMSVSPYMGLD